MVRKTTEWLNADDIPIAEFCQVSHLGGQQPPFTHLATEAYDLLCRFDRLVKWYWRGEAFNSIDFSNHDILEQNHLSLEKVHDGIADFTSTIEFDVLELVLQTVEEKSKETGDHDLARL